MAEVGGARGGNWLVAAALAVGVLSALALVVVLAAPQSSIPLGATNLTPEIDLDSVLASAAVSSDGDRVAVVWVEEVELVERARGSVWLSWASESTGSGWSGRIAVFSGGASACAVGDAAVAVTGTVAHVAYVVWSPCTEDTTQSVISYTVCHLTEPGSCEAAQTIASADSVPPVPPRLSGVDIALDNGGDPHFVYALYETTGFTATVYYRGGVSQPAEQVPDSTKSLNPAIAWSDGDVHVVWEEQTGTKYDIVYNRRDSGGVWDHPSTPPTQYQGTAIKYPRNPDIAVSGEQVVVTWDWQWTVEADEYVLAYTRYLTDVSKWMDGYEVGTQGGAVEPLIFEGLRESPYYTYTATAAQAEPVYTHYLRPTVALNREGMPAVVWHADQEGRYDIMYSQAESMTVTAGGDSIFSWSEPTVFNRGTQGDFVSPVLAEAPVISPTLHVAYLRRVGGDWETYYEGREAWVVPGSPGDLPFSVFLPSVLRGYLRES